MIAHHQSTEVPGVAWEGTEEFPVLRVENIHASARIALQGAHVMTHEPKGQRPVLWMSRKARGIPGKALRGGIPLCWPWFGPHPTDKNRPAHGFARTTMWRLESAVQNKGEGHVLTFRLPADSGRGAGWTGPVDLSCRVTVGTALEVSLIAGNPSPDPLSVGGALHSYFAVADVTKIRVRGLENRSYVDQLSPEGRRTQMGEIRFSQETDRVYEDPGPLCAVEDPILERRIRIEKSGSRSTVVWNPWTEKASSMADVGAEQFPDFVCVETANALFDVVTIPPGGTHTLSAVIRSEKL